MTLCHLSVACLCVQAIRSYLKYGCVCPRYMHVMNRDVLRQLVAKVIFCHMETKTHAYTSYQSHRKRYPAQPV